MYFYIKTQKAKKITIKKPLYKSKEYNELNVYNFGGALEVCTHPLT